MEEMFHCFIPTSNVAVALLLWLSVVVCRSLLLLFRFMFHLIIIIFLAWLAVFIFHFSRGSVNDLLPQRPIINTSVMGLYEGRINGLG
jgi:hypothetical protein